MKTNHKDNSSFVRRLVTRTSRTIAVAAVFASLLQTMAMAREDYCLNQTTKQIDQRATASYRSLERQSNQAIMNRLSGVWLSTITSPATNKVSYLYQSFTRLGIYSYTSYTCTLQNTFCRRDDGTGLYAVRANGTNRFLGTRIVSDTGGLNHACLGVIGTFVNNNTIISGRTRLQRVR